MLCEMGNPNADPLLLYSGQLRSGEGSFAHLAPCLGKRSAVTRLAMLPLSFERKRADFHNLQQWKS